MPVNNESPDFLNPFCGDHVNPSNDGVADLVPALWQERRGPITEPESGDGQFDLPRLIINTVDAAAAIVSGALERINQQTQERRTRPEMADRPPSLHDSLPDSNLSGPVSEEEMRRRVR